jgi:hypothetical protein
LVRFSGVSLTHSLFTLVGSRVLLHHDALFPNSDLFACLFHEPCEATCQFSDAFRLPPFNGFIRGQRHLVADADRLLASFTQSSHEIYRQWKASHMDEKSASRTLALHFSIGDARTMYSLNDSNRSASPANLISNHPQSGHRRIHSADVNAVLCASRSSEWYLVAATVEVAAEHEASGLA